MQFRPRSPVAIIRGALLLIVAMPAVAIARPHDEHWQDEAWWNDRAAVYFPWYTFELATTPNPSAVAAHPLDSKNLSIEFHLSNTPSVDGSTTNAIWTGGSSSTNNWNDLSNW
ncbi:MAG TPA: hypothetical protein VGF73_06235, partial [Chthoniobacterales bacterium]